MIGERSVKEPMREAKTWRKRSKIWNKLEKSGIVRFIEKIHGFNKEITKLMVNTWKEGMLKLMGFLTRLM